MWSSFKILLSKQFVTLTALSNLKLYLVLFHRTFLNEVASSSFLSAIQTGSKHSQKYHSLYVPILLGSWVVLLVKTWPDRKTKYHKRFLVCRDQFKRVTWLLLMSAMSHSKFDPQNLSYSLFILSTSPPHLPALSSSDSISARLFRFALRERTPPPLPCARIVCLDLIFFHLLLFVLSHLFLEEAVKASRTDFARDLSRIRICVCVCVIFSKFPVLNPRPDPFRGFACLAGQDVVWW